MIKFKVIERKNPVRPAEKKFYPTPLRKDTVDIEMIAKEISHATSFTEGDTVGMVRAFAHSVVQHILKGNAVRLDKLGIFSLTMQSKGANTAKEYNVKRDLKKVRVRFLPDTYLKTAIRPDSLTFLRADEHGVVSATENEGA